jgi:hypothetical protein
VGVCGHREKGIGNRESGNEIGNPEKGIGMKPNWDLYTKLADM